MLPFGLDISDALIRLVVLQKRRQQWLMPIRAEMPVPEGLITDGEITHQAEVVELLKDLIKAAGLKSRLAIVSLPERHTFIKKVNMARSTTPLAEQVQAEAAQHVPYAWDEVYSDWQAVPELSQPDETAVLIGAAPKATVDSYLSVLDQAGLQTVRLEIESLAIARACLRPTTTGAHMLLDLGRTRSTLILSSNGIVLFSATVRYAGKELNRFIADTLKVSMTQAERAKEIFGLDPALGKGVLYKVLAPQLDILVEKIKEVNTFYLEHFPDATPIQTIGLTGSGARLRQIDQELARRLGQPVQLQPAWVLQELFAQSPEAAELPFTYATAAGLAMGNFNS